MMYKFINLDGYTSKYRSYGEQKHKKSKISKIKQERWRGEKIEIKDPFKE